MAKLPRTKKLVPGPSPNSATNLLLADIAIRVATRLARRMIERKMVRLGGDQEASKQMVENRALRRTMTSMAVSRVATRSVPGAMLVGGSVLAKALFDRGGERMKARREGRQKLLERTRRS